MAAYVTHDLLGGSEQNLSASFKSLVSVLGAASSPRRGMIYYLFTAADGAPSVNNNIVIDIASQTADDGTKTNITPVKKNPADAVATTLSRANFSAEGTIGSSGFISRTFNQLVAYEWRADDGDEIIWAATANTGYVLRAKGQTSGYASTMYGELDFVEI